MITSVWNQLHLKHLSFNKLFHFQLHIFSFIDIFVHSIASIRTLSVSSFFGFSLWANAAFEKNYLPQLITRLFNPLLFLYHHRFWPMATGEGEWKALKNCFHLHHLFRLIWINWHGLWYFITESFYLWAPEFNPF